MNFTHVYSGNPVDRGEKERRDDQWIADKAKDATSKFLPLRDLNVLVTDGEDRLGWIDGADLNRLDINSSPVFLGLLGETAHFTVDISAQNKAVAELSNGNGYRFVDARLGHRRPGQSPDQLAQPQRVLRHLRRRVLHDSGWSSAQML